MTAAMARRGPALLPVVLAADEAGATSRGPAVYRAVEPGSYPEPFVVGYIDTEKLQDGEDAVAEARAQIARYAAEHRLMLGNIYADYAHAGGSQFRVLLVAVQHFNPQLVLVPSLDHVDSADDVGSGMRTRLEQIAHGTAATVRPVTGDAS